MTHLDSAITTLPCVGIHLDDLVLTAALPATLAGAHETPARHTAAIVLGFAARPPLSDEEDEDGPHDPADDDEEDEDEDDGEEDEDEEDEDEEGDDEEGDDEGDEDEDEESDDDDDDDGDEDEDDEEDEEEEK
jgi:hypothetical protein